VSVNGVVGDSTNRANIAGTLAHSNDVARLSADWLRDNRETLTQTLDKIEATFTKAQDMLASTQAQLNTSLVGFDTTLVQINEVSGSLRKVLDAMNSDQSTAGKLLHDDELYTRLNKVLGELDSLSVDVREHGLKMRHTLKIF
jgi:phospholipid/cholesterol/gamma-HCH transport system substrate-binding protein